MTCTVAVIGCGPGGMFFQHAIAHRRKKLQEEGNMAAIASLPQVTIFERSSSPGGVWKANRNANETNMYEALWTNGKCYTVFLSPFLKSCLSAQTQLHTGATFAHGHGSAGATVQRIYVYHLHDLSCSCGNLFVSSFLS